MHLKHAAYLTHVKLTGAQSHYNQFYKPITGRQWHELTETDQQNHMLTMLEHDKLKLIVSIDGDKSVAVRKGFKPDKANGNRPILSWQTRANSVANSTTPIRTAGRVSLIETVDAITIHGKDDFDANSPHHNALTLAEHIQPNTWTMFEESDDLTTQAPHLPSLGRVALVQILDTEQNDYMKDALIGSLHTTSILRRAMEPK